MKSIKRDFEKKKTRKMVETSAYASALNAFAETARVSATAVKALSEAVESVTISIKSWEEQERSRTEGKNEKRAL